MRILMVVLLGGCASGKSDTGLDALRSEVLASLAEKVAARHYTVFARDAMALGRAAETLCAEPGEDTLRNAQDAWMTARAPWKRTQIIKFGPSVEYPHRLGPKLDDGPVDVAAVMELLASTAALEVSDFDAMGTATRGLPVVELLLWQGSDPLQDLTTDGRRCAALAGSAGDAAVNAERLRVAWEDEWSERLSTPAAVDGDLYATPQDAIDEWVNRMAFTVEDVRIIKLGGPVGDDSGGEPRPELLESAYSGRSLLDAQDALAGVSDVWTGDVEGDHRGIRDLVKGSELMRRVDARLSEASTVLASVPEPLSDTITSSPDSVADAQDSLRRLQVALQVDLAQALGVTVTFNDNDGD